MNINQLDGTPSLSSVVSFIASFILLVISLEAASIDGVWAYGRNFSVSELGRGHVISKTDYVTAVSLSSTFLLSWSHGGGD